MNIAYYCHPLIALANSLDSYQARKKCRACSGSKPFDTLMVFLKEFFEKIDFEKIDDKKACKITQ